MTTDSDKWAGRLVRSPKSGRDYTSARGPDKNLNQNQVKAPSAREQDLTDRFQNVDIRIDQLRMSTDNLEGRIEQFESLGLNDRLIKTERRGQQLGILVIVLAALLALSILRDVLHETGTDATSLFSRSHSSQSIEGVEIQASPTGPNNKSNTHLQEDDPKK
jgi:hypothetical protein